MATVGLAQAEPVTSRRDAKSRGVDYSRDILPILSVNCFNCHGPAEAKSGVRLDLRDRALKPSRSGATPIQPGKSSASELIRRIFAADAAERMPPAKTKRILSPAEKELLKQWIDEGAEYKVHWAFLKPVRPALPPVKNQAWAANEIDRFILARLEQAGLEPSVRADKTTLIRRLSLDLRGIPPALAEVNEFVADHGRGAYERLVERMLASPRYGEKMALLWLDLARFGDTSGYENDSTRQMWLWRDWVIAAFNQNMPFDQFTIEQLAGDLLPNATTEQKVASGFNRNTRFNEEGGADPEEFTIRYNVDRTNTLGQVWLGMTLGCAECHSHKYDPISQKEYYQLFAYFSGINEPFTSGNHNVPLPPILKFPSPAHARTMAKLEQEQKRLQTAIDKKLAGITYKDPFAGTGDSANAKETWEDVIWFDDQLPPGAKLVERGQAKGDPWRGMPNHPVLSGRRSLVQEGAGLHQYQFANVLKPLFLSPEDKLFIYVYLDPKDPPKSIMLQYDDGSWEHRVYWGADKCLLAGTAKGPQHFHAGPLPPAGQWTRLEIETAELNLRPDRRIGGMGLVQFSGKAYYDKPGLSTRFAQDDRCLTSIRHWEPRARINFQLPKEVRAALNVQPAKRSAEEKTRIVHYYLRRVYAPTWEAFEPLEKELDQITKKIKQTDEAIPYTMVSEEMARPRPVYLLVRGDFQKKAEKVSRAVPAIFPPLPQGRPNNRLGLAYWLTRPDHPLGARVAVNRLWAQMFGTGLVTTIGDFGTQGEYPSHPELLDWLATEFVNNGWNVKAILKKIALSGTYQQSSVSPRGSGTFFGTRESPTTQMPKKVSDALKIDPHNRLLSRAPRFRLSAEEIRDSALAISGLLSERIGGPSVMPYQPADFYKGKSEGWPWSASGGDDQYRRGMYTFWRRTTLHPMFAIFDAPSREECSVARARTNTPLQALVTLNDPTFVEAARVFAQKISAGAPGNVEARITYAFRTALARPPSAAEIRVLKARYETALRRYQADRDAAAKLLQVGLYPQPAELDQAEHAAWTSVCNIVLNLDETVMRE
jgi:hypothetical protein